MMQILAAGLMGLALQPALAWTDKPVRILVPAPAGGTMDVLARVLAAELAAGIGQPVVVDNKPGAGGSIAVNTLLAAPADGQTIMVSANNVLTEIPLVMKTAFDPLKDVRAVGMFARADLVLVSAPNFPAPDLKALIAYVKANPGKVDFASYSTGTVSQYAGMILNRRAGLDMQHVPFAGSPPALAQLMGGQIPLMFDGVVSSLPYIHAGKIKPYAVASKKRSVHLPQVPTFGERGYPELDFSNWFSVLVSAKMSPALLDRISSAVLKAGAAPKVHARLLELGFEPAEALSPAQLEESLRLDFERNAAIVKAFDIRLN
ncbi:tripartite tricarboxylate transporter substrate binding protein [Hydrogenophaga sp. 2FB]|uniref:tripartite tricarboxylate transporter substrate binding protein n=1 Tax=Hydrogenophaga sp. 2FB TaxID=2502187 RepID=UPI00207BAD83|nr:tripartite tricarboxylate transporter substrate binding protein [Hydrogenophaga sp. 2FB]